ncbi:MAG TPA: ATP-dependent DNA helicase RecQ [Treponema sp.]|nr:MAG: recombinase RecQ [Treponema sp. GWC1_61_84]HCM28416.1 ATP-dependent DNA helicase RecQ [Treponema sp.]
MKRRARPGRTWSMDTDELVPTDPVSAAARTLLGVNYLFPYQRLVVANLLEAAAAAGIGIRWPEGESAKGAAFEEGVDRSAPEEGEVQESGAELGRQIVILPTGAGKSLCFQLPALLLDRPTLVLYPILSLMADQERRLSERGFAPVVLRGGQDAEERRRIWNRLESGDARFLIANPEVLLTDQVMRRLGNIGIAHLVLDEAHCVSEWGESFRPSYLRVAEILEATRAPLATAFTATASPAVLEKVRRYAFGEAGARLVMGDPDRPNIDYSARGAVLKDLAVRDLLRAYERPAIVFCSSRARTERLARFLIAELPENETRFYHAGLERAEKDAVERWFFSSGRGILTATCAYGMGVDKANVRTVIHRDCPSTVEAYLQESGRAGRDGALSRAILLWGPDDDRALARMEPGPSRERFSALLSCARESLSCRRKGLLAMLGAQDVACVGQLDGPGAGAMPTGGCDVCRGEASAELRERASFTGFIGRNRLRLDVPAAARRVASTLRDGWTDEAAMRVFRRLVLDGELAESKLPWLRGKLYPRSMEK